MRVANPRQSCAMSSALAEPRLMLLKNWLLARASGAAMRLSIITLGVGVACAQAVVQRVAVAARASTANW